MKPTRPIEKFAQAVGKCSAEAALYGKCIVADYNSVHKDKCAKEFMKLKECYLLTQAIESRKGKDMTLASETL